MFEPGQYVLYKDYGLVRKVISVEGKDILRYKAEYFGYDDDIGKFDINYLGPLYLYIPISQEEGEKKVQEFILRTI